MPLVKREKMLKNRVIASVIGVMCVIITSLINNSKYSESKSRPLRVLVVCGHNVDCARAIGIATSALDSASKEVGREIRIVAAYQKQTDMPGNSFLRVLFWLKETAEAAKYNKADATLVFVEPFSSMQDSIDMDEESILGRASGIGNIGAGYALAWCKIVGSNKYSSMVVKHELGHLLGAEHSAGDNIMNSLKASEYPVYSSEQISKIKANLALLN